MSATVFAAVLFAAFLHAGWNAILRGGTDATLSMAAIVLGQAMFGAACLPFLPMPAAESWPWIASGAALHIGYQFFLLSAYKTGALSEVYPLARGAAPLLVTLVSVTVLGVALSAVEWAGIALICCGLVSPMVLRFGGRMPVPGRAAVMALGASGFIAAYSLNDGLGARLSGSAVAFYGWLTVLNAGCFLAILGIRRRRILRELPAARVTVLLGGGASFAAYALVVWAFTQAPIPIVAALRETSILFALAIGALFLREPLGLGRVGAALLILAGAVSLRLGAAS